MRFSYVTATTHVTASSATAAAAGAASGAGDPRDPEGGADPRDSAAGDGRFRFFPISFARNVDTLFVGPGVGAGNGGAGRARDASKGSTATPRKSCAWLRAALWRCRD